MKSRDGVMSSEHGTKDLTLPYHNSKIVYYLHMAAVNIIIEKQ